MAAAERKRWSVTSSSDSCMIRITRRCCSVIWPPPKNRTRVCIFYNTAARTICKVENMYGLSRQRKNRSFTCTSIALASSSAMSTPGMCRPFSISLIVDAGTPDARDKSPCDQPNVLRLSFTLFSKSYTPFTGFPVETCRNFEYSKFCC